MPSTSLTGSGLRAGAARTLSKVPVGGSVVTAFAIPASRVTRDTREDLVRLSRVLTRARNQQISDP